MKKPISLLRIALLLMVMTTLLLAGCRRLPTLFEWKTNSSGTPSSQDTPPREPEHLGKQADQSEDRGEQAVQTVTDYLNAIDQHDFATAYGLLSRDSQRKHSRAEFEQQSKQGMPQYDLKTARASITGNRARVEVRQLEDPATHGFSLARENGKWKIVYRGGGPGQPYAD
jgi:hypothetical protein